MSEHNSEPHGQVGSVDITYPQTNHYQNSGTSGGWQGQPHQSVDPYISHHSDHAINYGGGGGGQAFDTNDPCIRRHHSDSAAFQGQSRGNDNGYSSIQNDHNTAYHYQVGYDNNHSTVSAECLPNCAEDMCFVPQAPQPSRRAGTYCYKSDTIPCSGDPHCNPSLNKCACSPLCLDNYTNPFKLKKNRRPAWVALCARKLRFYAYYQEPVPESSIENYRIHQVEIRYFVSDGTMEVFEPTTFDPGFPQGVLINRQRMPMPDPIHDCKYSLEDLNVGCEITLFGKTFYITGVDDYTRWYLNRMEGRSVKDNMCMPEDCYTNWRLERTKLDLFPRRANVCLGRDKRGKFLIGGGKVLRFWAYWDTRCDCAGLLRQFVLHYYLADDTVEIRETVDPDGGPTLSSIPFLSKGRLLKDHKDLVPIVGIREEAILILNTTAGGDSQYAIEPTFMTDRLCPGVDEKEYITDKDLAIGAVINVYGRSFILVDCDTATKTYYREKYGVEDFTPLTLDKCELPREYPKMETPPHTGFGDEVDTLYNWNRLRRREPPQICRRQNLGISILENDVLCFDARLYNPLQKVNQARRFMIKVFMIDNTIQILEKPHPNTGFKQGRFLNRSKVRRRGSGLNPRFELGEESEYYEPKDYFIGSILDMNGFVFILTGAGELTLSYMEANYCIFPQSNFCLIIEKTKEAFGPLEGEYVLKLFSCKDSCLSGVMSMEDFRTVLLCLSKESLNEHEVTTLTRGFRVDAPKIIDFKTLQSVAQTELQRHGFDHHLLARVEYTLRYHDPCRFGHVDKETVRATLKGAKLPLDRLLVDFLVDHFTCVDDCYRINYCSLLQFLDWVQNPVHSASPAHITCVLKWLQPSPPTKNVTCVNYRAFLELVNPHFKCDLPAVCCPQPEEQCELVEEEQEEQEEQEQEEEECCEPQDPYSWCYNECQPPQDENSYYCQRERAGYVHNDTRIRSEDLRCDDELGVCSKEGYTIPWSTDNNEMLSEDLVDAYEPCDQDCGDDNEVLNDCDFIGSEDLYTKMTRPCA